MKRLFNTKKRVALLVSLVVVGASAFGAYAYFTSPGTGSGTAAVGANTTNITLYATVTTGLVPGSSEPVSFTASNSSTTTDGYVANVSLVSVTDPSGAPGCVSYLANNQGDFSFATPTKTEDTVVPHGTTLATAVSLPNPDALVWANSAVDQTPCVGETLQVNVSST